MDIVFMNLLKSDHKEVSLQNVISDVWHGHTNLSLFIIQDDLFKSIDGSPFAYYAPPEMLAFSAEGCLLSANGVVARQGIGASTRFHRLLWEVPVFLIRKDWLHMAHGTSPAIFYKPTTHVFLWTDDGREAKADVIQRYPYLKGNYGFKIQAEEFYRKPGLTYGKRTEDFTVQILPSEHVFSFEGTAIFTDGTFLDEWALLALMNSKPIKYWLSIVCAEHKAYNYVEALPVPKNLDEGVDELIEAAKMGRHFQQSLDGFNLTSPNFWIPALLQCEFPSIGSAIQFCRDQVVKTNSTLDALQRRIDDVSLKLYCINSPSRCIDIEKETIQNQYDEEKEEDREYDGDKVHEEQAISISSGGSVFLLNFKDYLFGIILGRWDVRIAINQTLCPKIQDPFDPLPICPPGMIVGPDGLPAQPNQIVSEEWLRARPNAITLPPEGSLKHPTISDVEYPLRISWAGILADDPGFNGDQLHQEDIIRRVREVLDLIWKDKAADIEQEACDILSVPDLRAYFRKSFFTDHIKRYSKSRRKAPIYWQLATPSGSYAVWVYYHRFTKDTFYKILNDYVAPKLQFEERDLTNARVQYGASPTAGQRKEIADRETFVAELKAFKDEVARIAPLWKPDLNDGVIINFAPLWRLIPQNRAWQKECKSCWDKLVNGDYDWAHLAMHLWPERVVPKCAKDRSLAIAHGLDAVFWEEDEKGKSQPKKVEKDAVARLIAERTSPAVKAALESLLKAPDASPSTSRKRKKTS